MIKQLEPGRAIKVAGGSEISTPSILNLQTQIDRRRLIRDTVRNLVMKNNVTNPAYQLDITADEVVLQDSNAEPFNVGSISGLVDIEAGVGAGGLDTGTEAADTWYYIWLISNGSDVDALLSLSSTAPTMPSGYTYKALIGAVYNDSGSDFINFYQNNYHVSLEEVEVLTSGSAATPTAVDLSAVVPPIATRVGGSLQQSGSVSTSGYAIVLAYINSIELGLKRVYRPTGASLVSIEDSFSDLVHINNEIYYYKTGDGSATIKISSWDYN